MSDQSHNVGHASRVGNLLWGIAALLGIATGASIMAWGFLGNLVGGLLLAGCLAGWLTIGGYLLLHKAVIDPAGDAIGRIIVSSGGSTPSVAQHSNIEALEMRGEYVKARDAYRAAIAADPHEIVACEKLAQLAFRQLKDFDTAVWAFHQAEQRSPEPRRKAGFALLAVGILRDNMHDAGRTVVELRKVLERYPEVPNAAALRAELEQLKATLFEAQPPQ